MSLPKWAIPQPYMQNPLATNAGWTNSKTGELYQGHRGLKNKIDALGGSAPKKSPAPVVKKVNLVDVAVSEMDKDQLEAWGRENGVELDRRKSKKAMIADLNEAL